MIPTERGQLASPRPFEAASLPPPQATRIGVRMTASLHHRRESPEFAANAEAMKRWSRTCAASSRGDAGGAARRRRRATCRAASCWRASASTCCSIRDAVPRAVAARRLRHVRRRRPFREPDHRHRPRQRPRMRDRRQRRHHQGRHLLPDDGEEAPARAGDRAREPSALRLPGRFRRRASCRCRTRSFPTSEHFGRIFYNQARMSALPAFRRSRS